MSDEVEHESTNQFTAGIQANTWLPATFAWTRTITKRWTERADDFANTVRDHTGMDDEQIRERLEDREDLAETVYDALGKAARTPDEQLRDTLAKLVAGGLRDDAKVDEATYLTSVVTQLLPFDLRVLSANFTVQAMLSSTRDEWQLDDLVPVGTLISFVPGTDDYTLILGAVMKLHGLALLTDRVDGNVRHWERNPEVDSDDPISGGYALTPLAKRLFQISSQSNAGGQPT